MKLVLRLLACIAGMLIAFPLTLFLFAFVPRFLGESLRWLGGPTYLCDELSNFYLLVAFLFPVFYIPVALFLCGRFASRVVD